MGIRLVICFESFNMRVKLRDPELMSVEVDLVEVARFAEVLEPFSYLRMAVGAIFPFERVGAR